MKILNELQWNVFINEWKSQVPVFVVLKSIYDGWANYVFIFDLSCIFFLVQNVSSSANTEAIPMDMKNLLL